MNEVYFDKKENYKILEKGKEGEFYWCILSLGSHPCCYIGLPKEHKFYGKHYDEIPLEAHGGLTYAEKDVGQNPVAIDLWWIGWDYAHLGDYSYYPSLEMKSIFNGGNKWTLEELKKEVFEVLKSITK